MKVYEVMELLSSIPAGAELEVSKTMTLQEVLTREATAELSVGNEKLFNVGGVVTDIGYDSIGETRAFIYLD